MIHLVILFLVAVGVNIPLGYWREKARKFSASWFVLIHASIPLLVFLRIHYEISNIYIPVSIGMAVLGQLIGSRWRRRQFGGISSEEIKG